MAGFMGYRAAYGNTDRVTFMNRDIVNILNGNLTALFFWYITTFLSPQHFSLGISWHNILGIFWHTRWGSSQHFSLGTCLLLCLGSSHHFSLGSSQHFSLGTSLHCIEGTSAQWIPLQTGMFTGLRSLTFSVECRALTPFCSGTVEMTGTWKVLHSCLDCLWNFWSCTVVHSWRGIHAQP